jgi:hypothetical protein
MNLEKYVIIWTLYQICVFECFRLQVDAKFRLILILFALFKSSEARCTKMAFYNIFDES